MWIDALSHCNAEQLAAIGRVHSYTLSRVVENEGGGNNLALNVNKLPVGIRQPHPQTTGEAVETASKWISLGFSVDLGYVQLNSRNLTAMHTTVEQVLGTSDEAKCANLAAGATILATNYSLAAARLGEGQPALQVALSLYQSGTWSRGFTNGYVAKYYTVPALPVIQQPQVIPITSRKRRFADTDVW